MISSLSSLLSTSYLSTREVSTSYTSMLKKSFADMLTDIVWFFLGVPFQTLSCLMASSQMCMSSLWMSPAFSSVSIKAAGMAIVPSGLRHLARASAPMTVPSLFTRGCR